MTDSFIYTLSKRFSPKATGPYKVLTTEKREHNMSKQLLRPATSIGANHAESRLAQSLAGYLSKIRIALKEANETLYRPELLYESCHTGQNTFETLSNDMHTIIGTSVNNINKTERRRWFSE